MQTVYEAAGGEEGLLGLARAGHTRVLEDEVVSHAFSHGFQPDHTERLAAYWAEAIPGALDVSGAYGDESSVVRMHSGNGLHEQMVFVGLCVLIRRYATLASPRAASFPRCCAATSRGRPRRTMSRYHQSADDVPDGLRIPQWSWDGLIERSPTE